MFNHGIYGPIHSYVQPLVYMALYIVMFNPWYIWPYTQLCSTLGIYGPTHSSNMHTHNILHDAKWRENIPDVPINPSKLHNQFKVT